MKRLLVLLALCLGLALSACGGTAEPPTRESAGPEPAVTVEFPAETSVPGDEASPEDDVSPEDAPAEAPSVLPVLAPAPEYSAWWGGKWYGWAVFTQARGRFLPQQDTSWDVVAQIEVDGSEGSIQIFDITSPDEPELTADVRFAQGLTEHGKMICRYGTFIDIGYGSNTWSCDPGEGPESRLEHTISFSFTYSDAENSEDSVLVYYILRPWGMLWDDVREADTSGMLYEDMMPQHYEDWYLPQLG